MTPIRKRNKIKKWFLIFIGMVLLQTGTFFLMGENQLKKILLSDRFVQFSSADSVLITDYYEVDCGNETSIYSSHHLKDNVEELKEKLKVSFIVFQEINKRERNAELEKNFRNQYKTYIRRLPFQFKLSDFYSTTQSEWFIMDGKHCIERTITYRWIFLYWIKTLEYIESWECSAN